jgi:hypothetical protein
MEKPKALGAVLLCAALVGCATSTPPVREVAMVADAFGDLHAASQPLLDELAVAERAQGQTVALERALQARQASQPGPCGGIPYQGDTDAQGNPDGPGVIAGFCNGDAPYYSTITDPPATHAFRGALRSVGDYTQLLVILAEGHNIEAAQAQLHTLAANLGSAVASVGGVTGAPTAGMAPALTGLVAAVEPLTRRVATRNNIEELRRLVLQESPKVERVIAALRDSAPVLFDTVTERSMGRLNTVGLDNAEVAADEITRIEAYRESVSTYVVLLEQYRALLHDLVAVYDTPQQPLTLELLAQRSAALSAGAEAWRRTLSNLRAGLR